MAEACPKRSGLLKRRPHRDVHYSTCTWRADIGGDHWRTELTLECRDCGRWRKVLTVVRPDGSHEVYNILAALSYEERARG